jgi:hypothetical protein
MKVGSIDGTHGFAKNLWDQLADRGIWGVPRCGLIYQKREAEREFALIQRMPWFEELSVTEEDLRERQDYDHERIAPMFKAIGVEVVDRA